MDSISQECMFTGYSLMLTPEVEGIGKVLDLETLPVVKQNGVLDYQLPEQIAISKEGAPYQDYRPSDLEKGSPTRQAARERNQKIHTLSADRPTGNVFGTVMHRSLQLLVDRWSRDFSKDVKQLEPMILASVNQAIMENYMDIGENTKAYASFLPELVRCIVRWASTEAIFAEDVEVYTEFPFSFYEEKMQLDEQEIPVWMNGTADVILKDKEGKLLVLDYKSDNDAYLTEEEFVSSVKEKYSGQLAMYQYAISRLFKVQKEDISLGIISFTGAEDLHVRYTRM